ncbi:MAG: LCP family protein [Suilimivivens sp.]
MDKKKWVKHVPLFIIEVLVLLIAIGALYIITKTTGENGVKKDKLDEEKIAVNEEIKEKVVETKEEAVTNKYTGIYNVAFFGVDARDENLGKGNNRSDTIMICSIDMDKHEIRLISIYRDTYLNVGNDTYGKCNKAYALGGPEQALGMINMNTDLYITDYVTVGFEGLTEAVDALGGVEIDVREEEIQHLNNYQISMVGDTSDGQNFTATAGVDYTPVTEPGLQTLNGLQATAYCRIRYIGDDFERTERQRDVLIAMMEKAKKASISSLVEMINAVMPHVVTSIDVEDIIAVLGMIGDYKVTVSDGFPFADKRNGGTIGTEGSCIVPTSLEDNVIELHEILYGEEDYEPTKELKSYSAKVEEDTKDRLMY